MIYSTSAYDFSATAEVLFSILCTVVVIVGTFYACAPTEAEALLSKSVLKKTETATNSSWVNTYLYYPNCVRYVTLL